MTTVCRTERVYRRKLAENLRRFPRSGSCGPRRYGKKVQQNGSRQMKFCHLANVRSSPIADKLLQCRECPLSANRDQRTAAAFYSISSNSAHIHGTHVPVEEPSTAS